MKNTNEMTTEELKAELANAKIINGEYIGAWTDKAFDRFLEVEHELINRHEMKQVFYSDD